MLRNMVTSLFLYERIRTTLAKAKELRRVAERMVTLGKRGDLGSRRMALGYIRDKKVVKKLFENLAQRYGGRNGGYTRMYKVGPRLGDCAPMVFIELVDRDTAAAPKKRVKKEETEEAAN
jgi:large subunit ribosomal protein L17